MKYLNKIIITILTIVILIFSLNLFIDYGRKTNNNIYNKAKKILPQNFKNFLTKNIFIFSHTKKLESQLIKYQKLLNSVSRQLKNNEIGYNYIKENGLEFVKFDKKNLISKNKKDEYELLSFRNIFLLDNGKRAYLETDEENIFIISGNGLLNFINIDNLRFNDQTIFFSKIDTNLNQFIGTVTTDTENDGHNNSSDVMGIKGMKIFNDNIFISYVKEISKDCFTTAILKAEINLNKLDFKEFFSPNQCVKRYQETGRFYPYLTGGAMDLYKDKRPNESQQHYVKVGRIVSFVALIIAMIVAKPLLGNFDQAFQYIQEFTGFFTPGICALFVLGMFWKKTTANGGLLAALGSFVLSIVFRQVWPELPFIDRVGIVFLLCVALAVVVSLLEKKGVSENAVDINDVEFKTTKGFNVASIAVVLVTAAFYITWW